MRYLSADGTSEMRLDRSTTGRAPEPHVATPPVLLASVDTSTRRTRIMPRPLRRSFFARDVHEVAPELIGAVLNVNGAGGVIVEVEAYHHTDPAAHSYNG